MDVREKTSSEKRLIDANELLEDGIKIEYGIVDRNFLLMVPYRDVKESIKKAPTIDAVPVIRCGKCVLHGNCFTEDVFVWAGIENPFCCVGKRKEGVE